MIDLAQALRFIEALTGEAETPTTFQAFDDSKQKRGELARVIHGSLGDVVGVLSDLQRRGAGIFVTVNATDGRGRAEKNILALRALFVDADESELVLDERVPPPSIIVRSARGKHASWLLDAADGLAAFGPAQRRLAEAYGADPKIHDLPRVMRLPGSMHQKGEPVRVQLEHAQPYPHYTIKDVVSLLPERRVAARAASSPAMPPPVASSERLEQARRYLSRVPPAVEGEGGDEATYRAACYAARDFGLSEPEALSVLGEWNARCSPPWDEKRLAAKVRGALKYGKRPIGSKLLDVRRPARFAGFANGMRQ